MRASLSILAVSATALIGASSAAAQTADVPVTFSGSVAVTSDYTFRGISQTLDHAAIQGGIDAAGPFGLYAGFWGSSLNFGETDPNGRAQAEMDVSAGIGRTLAGTDVDLGFVYYGYPGTLTSLNYDFVEFGLGLSRDFGAVSTGVNAAWSPDYFASSGSAVYVSGSLGVAIPTTPLSLSASVGHQSIETNDAFGTPDYVDWSAGVSLGVLGLDLGASVVGTNLSKAECFGGSDLCESRVVFSLGRGL